MQRGGGGKWGKRTATGNGTGKLYCELVTGLFSIKPNYDRWRLDKATMKKEHERKR